MANVLIVDDSATMRRILSQGLRQSGLPVDEIVEAEDATEALEACGERSPDLVLFELEMTNMTGPHFVRRFRERFGPETPVVMITTEGRDQPVAEAEEQGVTAFLRKPFTSGDMGEALRSLLD